jgi:signal transduction histidine kinase
MRASTRAALLATLPVLALGAETSRLAAAHPETALGGGAPWESLVQVGAAVAAVAAGVALMLERRVTACGLLLALTGPAILLAQLPVPDASSALLFTAGLAGGSLAPALAGSAAVTCPVAPPRRLDWALVTVSLVIAGAVLGLLPAAVFDPRAAGCYSCQHNLAEVHPDLPLYAALTTRWGLILTVGWGIGLAARSGWRWLRAQRVARLVHAPLVLAGAAISLLAAAAALHTLMQATSEIDGTLRALWLAQCGLVGVMAAGVAASGLRARRLARQVTQAVVAAVPDAAALTAALASGIGDPHLALVFPREGGAVDAGGRPARAAGHPVAVVRVTRSDGPVAEVRYSATLTGVAYLLVAAVRAAGLVLEHVAAQARLLAGLAELAASRQRIIEAGDAERQRLERDLHDGAQQRLIALQVALQMAGHAAQPEEAARYIKARRAVGVALGELRDIAHGIHPAALTDGGLQVGLRTLAETSPVPLVLDGRDLRRYPAAAEAAAYRLIADAVRVAGQATTREAITVTTGGPGGRLCVQLSTAGLDRAAAEQIVAGARDRIVALNGSVTLAAAGGEMTIEAVIPCAS